MGVRSLGNALASFGYKFGTTGLGTVTPFVAGTFIQVDGTPYNIRSSAYE